MWATCNPWEEENVGKPQATEWRRRRKLLCGHHKINKKLKWKMEEFALNYFYEFFNLKNVHAHTSQRPLTNDTQVWQYCLCLTAREILISKLLSPTHLRYDKLNYNLMRFLFTFRWFFGLTRWHVCVISMRYSWKKMVTVLGSF